MDNASLENIGASLERIAGVFAERRRQGHPSYGGATKFPFFYECLDQEIRALRRDGQEQLADALATLRSDAEAMDNG